MFTYPVKTFFLLTTFSLSAQPLFAGKKIKANQAQYCFNCIR
jgi:hypothetical protein